MSIEERSGHDPSLKSCNRGYHAFVVHDNSMMQKIGMCPYALWALSRRKCSRVSRLDKVVLLRMRLMAA